MREELYIVSKLETCEFVDRLSRFVSRKKIAALQVCGRSQE